MDEQVLKYREAKLMEPIYRMYKVIEQTDALKAQTLMSVAMQYIIEHFRGKSLQPTAAGHKISGSECQSVLY